ncbi:hypothetical protein C8F04DRAFT_1100354 [Mycena alexandri]|uniref:DUF6534 domain-containing protein n=1 Tax=Mycena alexandri TaxID=1745969 RepID=A0AAD6SVL0_9AGAR|nr:hypothetical protein C8F04DRAFT_1100354 [Mycena alexandri]
MKANIDNTYGVLFITAIVSACLYGVGILQFWMYIRKYHSKDPIVLKCLVITVMVCDTVQQALLCHAVYKYLVSSISDPAIRLSVVKTLIIELFFIFAIETLVQQFYCWRIFKIGRSLLLAGSVSILCLASTACTMVYAINAVRFALLAELISLQRLSIASNVLKAVGDVTISVVLIILLHSARTGFKRTTDLINRLMVFTFSTALPTGVCSLSGAISVGTSPSTFLYIFWFLLLGRFYTNSLLVTLNCREYIASDRDGEEPYALSLESRSLPIVFTPKQSNNTVFTPNQTNGIDGKGSLQDQKGLNQY